MFPVEIQNKEFMHICGIWTSHMFSEKSKQLRFFFWKPDMFFQKLMSFEVILLRWLVKWP